MSSQIMQHFQQVRKDDRFEQIDLLYVMHRLMSKKQNLLEKFEKLGISTYSYLKGRKFYLRI